MRSERGVVLLDVLIAVVIVATAGTSLLSLVAAGLREERDARARENMLATEQRLLVALTLLERRDLDQRIGQSAIGEFIVDVQRPENTLYRIALRQGSSPQGQDLVTVVYRPEPRP